MIEILPEHINTKVGKAFLRVDKNGISYETVDNNVPLYYMRDKNETLRNVAVRVIKDLKDKELM